MSNPWFILTGLIPSLVVFGFAWIQRWRRKQEGERPPQQEKLLRTAGHSLNEQLADLSDKTLLYLMASVMAAVIGSVGANWTTGSPSTSLGYCITFGLLAAACAVPAYRALVKCRNVRMGLLGEQAVAEHLQRLASDGFRIYHDIPNDNNGNVDHIAVGPTGVFAIETKARTKKPGHRRQQAHEALYDGQAIQFPHYTEADALRQVQANARWVGQWLTQATGRKVTATPIVALPGWLVSTKVNPKSVSVRVLNAKQLPGFISDGPTLLSPDAIQQVCYQVEQKCRDVEF